MRSNILQGFYENNWEKIRKKYILKISIQTIKILQSKNLERRQTCQRVFNALKAPLKSYSRTSFKQCVEAALTSAKVSLLCPLRAVFYGISRKICRTPIGTGEGVAGEAWRCCFEPCSRWLEAVADWCSLMIQIISLGSNACPPSIEHPLQSF